MERLLRPLSLLPSYQSERHPRFVATAAYLDTDTNRFGYAYARLTNNLETLWNASFFFFALFATSLSHPQWDRQSYIRGLQANLFRGQSSACFGGSVGRGGQATVPRKLCGVLEELFSLLHRTVWTWPNVDWVRQAVVRNQSV